ncbi:hypothetical protein IMZ48_13550 [Candidatus Bathyarchaeota archaeon]|nr:hypothetical protein [Candidatus Bathyarchaeota archaeon]
MVKNGGSSRLKYPGEKHGFEVWRKYFDWHWAVFYPDDMTRTTDITAMQLKNIFKDIEIIKVARRKISYKFIINCLGTPGYGRIQGQLARDARPGTLIGATPLVD